ncbi:MAG TPA: hypothetical protein DCM02_10560 [Flavobacterium sp.]|nr:hypothetical protein [Flavobacterium sp.]HAT76718.1 hypothetical protein [Flavobacterium sp.]HAT79900.1 hypothetical protein [Flavobacterium sp.]
MEAINITAFTQDASQIDAIKAVMKALKIKFEISKVKEKPYNPEFVAKIKRSEEQYRKGQFTRVKAEDLKQFIDNL